MRIPHRSKPTSDWRRRHFCLLWTACVALLTLPGADASPRGHAARPRGGAESGHQRAPDAVQRAPGGTEVWHRQLALDHARKGGRRKASGAKAAVDVAGPNICGTKCCPGWTVAQKTKQCTKPRCQPRCHNRAVCRQQNICECRPGFRGHRCEHANIAPASTALPWVVVPTPPPVSTTTPTSTATSSPAAKATHAVESEAYPVTNKQYALRWQLLSLKEAQNMLLKKTLANGGQGKKITSIMLKYIDTERDKLLASPTGAPVASMKTFHTERGLYTLILSLDPVSSQTARQRAGAAASGGAAAGHGAERIKVLFTPTICKVRCTQGRCTNFCERGNVTTLYNSHGNGQSAGGHGFRVFLCPMLCQNGGICIQKDRCICPPNFTGKFCQIPVLSSSTNDIEKTPPSPSMPVTEQLMQSEYILPLQNQQAGHASGAGLVKVRVQHPPEASVKIHQVIKVGHGPTAREQSETVTWSAGLSGARTSVLPGERAEAPPPIVQAQTIRGDATYTESSGFKYCFREVRNGQCSSPLPGLRSQETCCRGVGRAWGINDCTLCPANTENFANGEGSCPKGFERINGTQCVDVNECSEPGICENGDCVNTRGSYTCVCRPGYLLDTSHGICISHKVISEEKHQCYRVVSAGVCSLPILKNITKQICCCSRVGKAWGRKCETCPFFGSAAFKEICPAGPGYHYSANNLQINQRLVEYHSTGQQVLVSNTGASAAPDTRPQQPDRINPQVPQARPHQPTSTGSLSPEAWPQQPSIARQAGSGTTQPTRVLTPVFRTQTGRPLVPATPRPHLLRPESPVCESRPQICGAGRCVDQPGGRHTCLCDPGHQLNAQRTQCQDINECLLTPGLCPVGVCENTPGSYRCSCPSGFQTNFQQTQCQDVDECRQVPNPCINGQCENTPGSYKCVCRIGFKLQGDNCKDNDECDDPLRCPGQECVNSQGSYRCVPCQPGFGLLHGQCSDIDECRQTPNPCSNSQCENTPGSYKCVCRTGFKRQGNSCIDVNECENALRCPGQECVNSHGSFRCVSCRPGFRLQNGKCADVDECRQTPSPCSNGQCENTLSSYRCVCHTGFRLQGNNCTDVNECIRTPPPCGGGVCENTLGSYRCATCQSGFKLLNGQCSDVNECVETPGICSNGRCENTPGSFRCACRNGYRQEGDRCTDVDECENALQCPGKECVNLDGSFQCVTCKPGFSLQNGQCQDVDECSQTPRVCANGRCKNAAGGYRCECYIGFQLQDNVCTDINECEDPLQCPGQQCVNSQGSYRCVPCRVGYSMQNGKCSDVDECQGPQVCGPESLCVNTDGSYHCECKPGYRALGQQCRDINECMEGEYCFPRGECINTKGSYRCQCAPGYRTGADGTSCLDEDECARPGVCQDGHCVNSEGSFQCRCQAGFTTNPEKTACLDVDECVDSEGAVCGTQRCENTIGSYRCFTSCEPGYRVTATGECVDVNECANETVCGKHSFCQNLIGTYQCMCDQGYVAAGDAGGCVDENECETMQGVCGTAHCENVEGSFMCDCPNPEEVFNPRSGQCIRQPREDPGTSSISSTTTVVRRPGGNSASLPPAKHGEVRQCYYNMADPSSCNVLAHNTTHQECCCTVGWGWGLECVYEGCPQLGTVEFQSLCPSGRGYVTTGHSAFSYRDVDECKLFDKEVCKNGRCVNNIPGYSCYCSSGFYYHNERLECVDNDECAVEEPPCLGGICINTMGSYYCTCEPPLVLDDSQQSCVNTTGLSVDDSLSVCWQHVTADLVCQRLLRGRQVTFSECCCQHGEAWSFSCALCPATDSEEYERLCSPVLGPAFPPPFPDRYSPGPLPGPYPGPRRGGGGSYALPYEPDPYSEPFPPRQDYPLPVYEDYSPFGGRRSGLRERPPGSYSRSETPYSTGPGPDLYYDEADFDPQYDPPRPGPGPPFRITDPRSEQAFGMHPPPPSVPEGLPLSLAPLPDNSPYSEDGREERWRFPPPFPPFRDSRRGETPRRVFERRFESYEGLGADECGIVHGCENGRCIRVAEGYTCDCFTGYQLEMTSMACIDINECEEPDIPDCINGRCINTDGSYRCQCLVGFIMSRRPNYCIPA
ncbi:latent-transforming growth factor beta-binding protein 4 isoform X2 [Denticeps clupeoides]|uniref:Latent-transforming growth factor beta-binding protein 4 n=1 Tax=Denticeps clupeoides TaxID=299321 RepID=A0AAY4D521_9TELE|nr:latent-transforming growth factor beta-binding protein 4-like isoform X2 [Denticeps clupeoides]